MRFTSFDDTSWPANTFFVHIHRSILELAQLRGVEPHLITDRPDPDDLDDEDVQPVSTYWLTMVLTNGAIARMSQDLGDSNPITLYLECVDDEFVYQDDLNEVISVFRLPPDSYEQVKQLRTWLPDRSAPKIKQEWPKTSITHVIKTVYKSDHKK